MFRNESGTPIASVVIPAHNEEAVIGRLLSELCADDGLLEVVVSCNGCTDATAEVARAAGAHVVEAPTASKSGALNLGDATAVTLPRFYIDADVQISRKAVVDVAQALASERAMLAAPPFRIDVEGRGWVIRAYFRVWARTPAVRQLHIGGGVFAMSTRGRERFDVFPLVIADDLFARLLFAPTEREVVPTDAVVIEAPRTVRALVQRRTRAIAGNLELREWSGYPMLEGAQERTAPWWKAVVSEPSLWPSAFAYAAIGAMAKILAWRRIRSGTIGWSRDDTTRARA